MALCLSSQADTGVTAALRVARRMHAGAIVTLLPDRGDRYLSTTLFRSICAQCPP